MDAELKVKWLDALQSGKYEKARCQLRLGSRYCCLGVLCDIIDPSRWADAAKPFPGDWVYGTEDITPPKDIADQASLHEEGRAPGHQCDAKHVENLIWLNDHDDDWDRVIKYIKEQM